MSFRIKTTHPSLEQALPPPKLEEKSAVSFFDIPDEKDTFTTSKYTTNTNTVNQKPNKPSGSDTNGIAIRHVVSAQADYL